MANCEIHLNIQGIPFVSHANLQIDELVIGKRLVLSSGSEEYFDRCVEVQHIEASPSISSITNIFLADINSSSPFELAVALGFYSPHEPIRIAA